MSSTETGLQNERPNRPGEFTFTWSIHNYSYCTLEADDYLFSPDFVVEFLGEGRWWLELYPSGFGAPGFISCYLCGGDTPCNFTISICKADGQFKEGSEIIYDPLDYKGYSDFLSIEELQCPNSYLANDTLTLRCRIWKTDEKIPISVKCDVHSKFKVSKLSYTWFLRDIPISNHASECEFDHSSDIAYLLNGISTFKINLINKGGLNESDIYFGIEMKSSDRENYYLTCKIHFLDSNRKVVHSESSEHRFPSSTQTEVFKFPVISKHNFYINKNEYAPRGQLTLKCEFSFVAENILETILYQTTNDIELQSSSKNGFASENELVTIEYRTTNCIDLHPLPSTEPDTGHEIWIKNMQHCYKDGKFSDFIIHTPGRQFPVSRTILSAHSEVFCAMFESDMKERKSGVVEIEDLDDDTVSKMLMYVYTSSLNEVDCSSAQKLYFAADKYGITALQKKCSIFLMGSIDNSNVCDILELANTLQDQDLKLCARDFVQTHAKKIINSEHWKKLMETNPSLTSETMQWILCNKFLI